MEKVNHIAAASTGPAVNVEDCATGHTTATAAPDMDWSGVIGTVIARLHSGSLSALHDPKTIEALSQIRRSSEFDYEVHRAKLREANPKVSVRDLDRLVKAFDSARSGPSTHNTFAQALLSRLTVEGHRAVTHESTLYVLDPATKIWTAVTPTALATKVAETFDGAATCVRATDYKAIANLVVDSATDERFFQDAPLGLACVDEFYRVDGEQVTVEALRPEHRQRVRLEFSPRCQATPHFDKFLHETFKSSEEGEEEEQRMLLQEVAGAIMTGMLHKHHRAVLFYDPCGRAGKGTLERILRKLVPSDFVSAVAPAKWSHESYVIQLKDARLNVVGELSEAQRIPADTFKAVIGGDLLTGRHLYERPISFKSEAAQLFMSNSLPAATEHGDAIFARWLILEFPNSLLRLGRPTDPGLADRIIESEMPGIAHWALEGAKRLLRNGKFSVSRVHDRLIAAARRGNSSVEEFIFDECDFSARGWIRRAEAYARFKVWCADAGRKVVSKGRFKSILENSVPLQITYSKLNGYEIFRGIDWKKEGRTATGDVDLQYGDDPDF